MAFSRTNARRALAAWEEGIAYVREHRIHFFEGFIARDAARLNTSDGEPDVALGLFAGAPRAGPWRTGSWTAYPAADGTLVKPVWRRRAQAMTRGRPAGRPGRRPPASGQGGGHGRMSVTSGTAANRIVPRFGRRPGGVVRQRAIVGSREASVARYPLIGYLAWVVLFGAVFAWEGLALARVIGVPALGGVFRVIMRYPLGRWALFALWLWAGWHFFIRGWHFLLRA
jgi:Family of unknown function (DUF6186)